MGRSPAGLVPGFGPVCSPELIEVGLDSLEAIREVGWREAWLRWAERFPARVNVNAAVGMLAAEKGVPWLSIHGEEKEEVRRMVEKLRSGRRNSARRGALLP